MGSNWTLLTNEPSYKKEETEFLVVTKDVEIVTLASSIR